MMNHLASQRITVAKLAGSAAEILSRRLIDWSAARMTDDPDEWSNIQWPPEIRNQIDILADRLRAHALLLPVIYFVEWSDHWSMGDVFLRWLTPAGGLPPLKIHGDRFELYGYSLPDGGSLSRHLKGSGPQQFTESHYFINRLREAIESWDEEADRSVLVVLREVVGGLVTDEEIKASSDLVPDWLSKSHELATGGSLTTDGNSSDARIVRDQAYLDLLHQGLVFLRNDASIGNVEMSRIEADHLHEMPTLVGETNERRHLYYLRAERSLYLKRLRELGATDYLDRVAIYYGEPWRVLATIARVPLIW